MKRTKGEIFERYAIFILGLFISSIGVALITKAALGTSPISSIPYVLSLNFPFSLGNFTIFFSGLLILLQLIILGKNFKPADLLQIPVSIGFGYFIDAGMFLLSFVHPENYMVKVIDLLIGCLILGIGVYFEVLADVVMLPGESFVRAVVFRWKTEFGTTKVCFDVSMSVIAAVLSFGLAGHLDGIREGTVVAALLVGFIARTIGRMLSFLPEKLYASCRTEETEQKEELGGGRAAEEAQKPFCIAIGRQYGSGGRDLGQALAKKLGVEFYDDEIIQLAAGSTGYTPEYISKREERMTKSFLYDLINEMYGYSDAYKPPKDEIYEAEAKVIREAAEKGSCVIVGRCADAVLKDDPRCIRIFFSAPAEKRIETVMKREKLDYDAAKRKIKQTDRMRADNYHYYTKQLWGMAANYDICLDAAFGEEFVIDAVLRLLEEKLA